MTADPNSNAFTNDRGFLSSIAEIEMECWQNDIAGTKEVLLKLGCTSDQAEAAIGSYLCRRFSRKETPLQSDVIAREQNWYRYGN